MTPETVLLYLAILVVLVANASASLFGMAILFMGLPHSQTLKELGQGVGALVGCVIFWYATTKLLQWLGTMVPA